MENYSYKNAKNVLAKLGTLIETGASRKIPTVYQDLSIFDWWTEKLSVTQMKQMRTFLKLAISLGYTGYVCFKVGVSGCTNGMWASKNQSTNGYMPDGEQMYRSFSPDYTYYQVKAKTGDWFPEDNIYDSCKSANQFKQLVKARLSV